MSESAPLNTESQIYTYQEALANAGNENKYQKRLIFLMSLQRLSLGFLFTAFPFLFRQPEFQCRTPGLAEYFTCEPTPENCRFEIEPVPGSENSLITYFGLYCERQELAYIAKNLFTAACGIGILILFPLADKVGRKPGLIGSYVLGSISLLLAPFTSNWAIFVSLLAISGLGFSPYMTGSFLILNEASSAKVRAFASVIVNASWTCGQIAGSLLAYNLHNDWRAIMLIGLGIPFTLLIPFVVYWVFESPMYLSAKRKYQQARDVLKKIAKINGHMLTNFEFSDEKDNKYSRPTSQKSYSFIDLIRYKSLRNRTFIGAFICFSIYFNYYGTIFTLSSVQVNTYKLTGILGTAEFIAYFASGFMTHNLPRRVSFAVCSAVSCLANCLFILFPAPESCLQPEASCYQVHAQLVLSTVNRFAVSILLAMSGLYINELYPTPVRALGTSVTIFIGRLGSFVATIALAFCSKYEISPFLFFGVICFPAILASMITKETKGLPLPEMIDEEDPNNVHYKGGQSKPKSKSLYLTFQSSLN